MSESIKSLIFAIMGTIVAVVGLFIDAGWEVITLGAVITLFATICIIMDCKKNKKQ